MLEQRAQLIDGEEAHSARARLHVVGRHDEDALHADPVLGWAGLQLQAPGVRVADPYSFHPDPAF